MEKDFLEKEYITRNEGPTIIEFGNKTFKVRQVSNMVKRRINNLEREVLLLEKKAQGELTIKEANKIANKIQTLHSKTAAYYLLGNWAIFIPFLFAIKWRLIDLEDSEVIFRINNVGSSNAKTDFSLANWQITKIQLALSTRLVGKGIEQYQERVESAEGMLAEDALPKKRDNK